MPESFQLDNYPSAVIDGISYLLIPVQHFYQMPHELFKDINYALEG